MLRIIQASAVLLLALAACSSGGTGPVQPGVGGLVSTGLEGVVRRGPVQPVCREGKPCDAPYQAGFTLRQNGRVVARFASDSAGHFLVYTVPGTYVVVPDDRIGRVPQSREVVVGSYGLTHVELTFDTGMR
jgi:hypothetical protein